MTTPSPYYPTILTLRQKLEKTLTPYLGNYGGTTLAIWVEPPSTPKKSVIGGLECIISRYRNVSSTVLLVNRQAQDIVEWLVTLKSNERTPEAYTKFDAAIQAIRLEFPYRRESINTFAEAETLLATFRLSENIIFNTFPG